MDELAALPASRHWARTRWLTAGLLLVWLAVNLVAPWFAQGAQAQFAFGFPLPFWVAAQGALLLYLALIAVYALVMDRVDARLAADA